jgi:hypothetical protein
VAVAYERVLAQAFEATVYFVILQRANQPLV